MTRMAAIMASAVLLVVSLSGTAFADTMVTSVRDSGGAVISNIAVDDLYPTDAREHSIYVDIAPSVATGEAAVVLENVTNLENGCNHPETASGDVTCDTEGGELSSQLQVTITPGRPAGLLVPSCAPDAGLTPVTATMAALEGQLIPLGETSAVLGRSLCFVVRQELPDMVANNLVQTDQITYDLRVLGALDLEPGATTVVPSGDRDQTAGRFSGEVSAVAGGRQPLPGVRGDGAADSAGRSTVRQTSLASTGAASLLLLVTGLATLAVGRSLRRRAGNPQRPRPFEAEPYRETSK